MDPILSIELTNIKAKLHKIHESLTNIETEPHLYQFRWPDILRKLNVLATQYLHLERDLQPKLQNVILRPEHLPSDGDPSLIPRVLLRTKHLPEVEKDTLDILKQYSEFSDIHELLALGPNELDQRITEYRKKIRLQDEEWKDLIGLLEDKKESVESVRDTTEKDLQSLLEQFIRFQHLP